MCAPRRSHAIPLDIQHFFPDIGQLPFGLIARRYISVVAPGHIRLWGNALRSILPLALSGMASSCNKADGVIAFGKRARCLRSFPIAKDGGNVALNSISIVLNGLIFQRHSSHNRPRIAGEHRKPRIVRNEIALIKHIVSEQFQLHFFIGVGSA